METEATIEPSMARHALDISPCHCITARQRYHINPSISIPWDYNWNAPLPLPAPDLIDLESDSGSNLDADNSEYPTGMPFAGHDENDDDGQGQDGEEIDLEDLDPEDPDSEDLGPEDLYPELNPPEFLSPVFWAPEGSDTIDSDSGDSDSEDRNVAVPIIARHRLNLTALSQRFNIYAAAYGDAIHICRVRSCIDHTLPARPDLVLKPPRSREAASIRGHIDPQNPHHMNHLIMGDFGEEEILLFACDDGDVIAYYNFQIETALLQLESGGITDKLTCVHPFFHQNVGKSAWGLAIHKKSRLIAVGNNKREVHVFAMELTDPQYASKTTKKRPRRELFLSIRKLQEGSVVVDDPCIQELLEGNDDIGPLFRQRQGSYHFILEIPNIGANIPNVAFSSNTDGDAIDVLAVDIGGKLWVLDIWSTCGTCPWFVESLHILHYKSLFLRNSRRRIRNQPPRGWGVLVLPESSFLPTNTFKESLGLSPAEAVYVHKVEYGYYIGTEKAIEHVKNNSTYHPWVRDHKCYLFNTQPDWSSDDLPTDWYDLKEDSKEEWTASQDEAADKKTLVFIPKRREKENPKSIVINGSSVMRTYEMDIELVCGDLDNTGIMFTNAIRQRKPPRTLPPGSSYPNERLANLLHVPELSLVVAGSLCGRVVLITLTRPINPEYSFKRGFRVEAILPTQHDEDRNLRPICPLLGVAIAPIPSAGGTTQDDHLLGERRYRIMLHYYDHRILSYEVYRDMMTSELSVI